MIRAVKASKEQQSTYLLALLIAIFVVSPAHSSQPQRIVSLAPVATEFLFELGLGESIVGVTTYCDRPERAKAISKIGGFSDPQLEAIIKLKPSLVVATPFGQAKTVVASLKSRGIQVIESPVDTLEQMRSFLSLLGDHTGKSTAAKQVLERFDHRFAGFQNKAPSSLRVLMLVSSSPIVAASPATFPGQVLKHIGVKNSVSNSETLWPVVSLEALLLAPPDIIVVSNGAQSLNQTRHDLKRLLTRHPHIRLFAPKMPVLQRPGPYLNEEIELLVAGMLE